MASDSHSISTASPTESKAPIGTASEALQSLSAAHSAFLAKTSRFQRLAQHPLWIYLVRPLLIAGIFLMLAFGLYANSLLMVSGGFLAGVLGIASVLVAVSLSLIVNLLLHGLKANSVAPVPTCQSIAAAEEVQAIIKCWPSASEETQLLLTAALLTHIAEAKKLLDPASLWSQGGLLNYKGEEDNLKLVANQDFAFLQRLEKAILEKQQEISPSDLGELNQIFGRLGSAEVDPTYRPALPKRTAFGLAALAAALLIGCVISLFYIATQGVNIGMWLMPVTAGLGFLSWVTTRYLLSRTSGGAYAEWATFSGVVLVIFSTLGVLSIKANVGLSVLAFGVIIPSLAAVFVLFSVAAYFYTKNLQTNQLVRKTTRQGGFYQIAAGTFLVLKGLLAIGCLFLAFLSIATLFNVGGLGYFSNLMDFALEVAVKALPGTAGYTLGPQWLSASSIATFAITTFMAFSLFKNLLQRSPATVADMQQYQQQIAWLVRIFKLIFVVGMIAVLWRLANSGAFLVANVGLFPIFLVISLVVPLFAGNVNSASFKIFNSWLGITPFTGKHRLRSYILRELLVLFLLAPLFFLSYMPGVSTLLALTLVGLAIGTTLLFRVGTLLWNAYVDPQAWAKEYIQSASSSSPAMLEKISAPHNVKMFVDYIPHRLFGHIRLRWEISTTDASGETVTQTRTFSWGHGGDSAYTQIKPDLDKCLSIKLPEMPGIVFTDIDQYITAHLTDFSFAGSNYSLIDNHCAHAALLIVQHYLKSSQKSLSNGSNLPPALYQAQLNELQRLFESTILTPKQMFQGVADVLLQINKLTHQGGKENAEEVEKLSYKIAQLDLLIAKARAENSLITLAEAPELLKNFKKQAQDKIAIIARPPTKIMQSAVGEQSAVGSDALEIKAAADLTDVPLGNSVSPRPQQPAAESLAWPFEKSIFGISWVARLKQFWWVAQISLLALLALMSAPGAAALLTTGLVAAIFLPIAVLALLGLIVPAVGKTASYNATQWLELGAKSAGAIGLIGVIIYIGLIPAAAFSMAFIAPLLVISAITTAYFFGRSGQFENPIETTWRLLAKGQDHQGLGAIERLEKNEKLTVSSLADTEKKQLLVFLAQAILAMEQELLHNEQITDKFTFWADQQPVGFSPLFAQDLQQLKNYQRQLESPSSDEFSISVQKGYDPGT